MALQKVIFPHIIGGMNLYQIVTLFSTFLFIESLWQTMAANDRLIESIGSHAEQQMRCYKWRHERNLWIAFFSLFCWLILERIHRITEDLDDLRIQFRVKDDDKISTKEKKYVN